MLNFKVKGEILMQIGSGNHIYTWHEDWVKTPITISARKGWSHHGIVVSSDSEIYMGHPDDPVVQVFDMQGKFLRSWDSNCTDTHGMTLVKEGDVEYIWIADNGAKRRPSTGYEYSSDQKQIIGQVIKTSLDGDVVMKLVTPPVNSYLNGDYKPTWVAVNENGNGDIWVADGYGSSEVHCFNKKGEYLLTINGEEGKQGHFDCPHAIFIDNRKVDPELYVADRSNSCVQVYDMDGNWKRVFGSEFLTSPSGFVVDGDYLVIAELKARLTICDIDDNYVVDLGDNGDVTNIQGWPNYHDIKGDSIRPELEEGKFNSPHGMAIDREGNLFISEWLIGGRSIKLKKN
tara:strand:- start:1531 stop:2562 length:1032 start_codon:yes stop_codon:yes gene_type:complete